MLIRLGFLLIITVRFVKLDEYLNEIEGTCYKTNKTYSCAKYKFFKYIDDYRLKDFNISSDSSVKFVDIPSDDNVSDVIGFTKRPRQNGDESEFIKIYKFFQRQADKFFNKQGLAIDLPDGVQVIEKQEGSVGTGRGKQEQSYNRKQIVITVLILLKIFKIGLLTKMTIVGLLTIKKLLIIGALLFPGIAAAIKLHCQPKQVHIVPHHEHKHKGGQWDGLEDDDWDRKIQKKFPFYKN